MCVSRPDSRVCVCVCMYACLSVCLFFFFFCLADPISESTSQLCREMPLRHDSGHMAPLVRIRHLSKSNCRVDKLNCAHMVTEGQRTTKSLKRFLSGLQRLVHMFSSAMLIAKNPHRRDEVIDL